MSVTHYARWLLAIVIFGVLVWLLERNQLGAQEIFGELLYHEIGTDDTLLVGGSMTENGLTLYYELWSPVEGSYILVTKREDRFAPFGKGSRLDSPVDLDGCSETFPCVSPDGRTLYFTASNKCRGGGGQGDWGEFYVARKTDPCDPDAPFSQVSRIDDQEINTEKNEVSICVSRDGKELVFNRKWWQLWTAQFNVPHDPAAGFRNERLLQSGVSLEGVFSASPSLSPCGHYLLWSDWPSGWSGAGPPRPDGHDANTTDIWMAWRDLQDDGTWGDFSAPVNLPVPVNTVHDEISPWLSYDGLTLLLVSNRRRPGSMQYAELVEFRITGDLCGLIDDPDNCSTDPNPPFRRGDCNDDGNVDISDAVCILDWLFLGGTAPGCVAVTNTNGDESADLSDAVYLLGHLFLGGPTPVGPFPGCGPGLLPADAVMGCVTTSETCH